MVIAAPSWQGRAQQHKPKGEEEDYFGGLARFLSSLAFLLSFMTAASLRISSAIHSDSAGQTQIVVRLRDPENKAASDSDTSSRESFGTPRSRYFSSTN